MSRGAHFSAAVMLGAPCETEIYLLGEALANALKSAAEKANLTKLIKERKLHRLLELIGRHLRTCANLDSVFHGSELHLESLLESIRVQRNDAVHPKTATVDEDSVRLSYDAFPQALKKAEVLRQ